MFQPLYPKMVVDAVNIFLARKKPQNLILFKGRETAFRQIVELSSKYIEYGVGTSTVYASAQSHLSLVAVETDQHFAKRISQICQHRADVQIMHVDCGAVGAWGRPLTYGAFENFRQYVGGPTEIMPDADLVLIDGRWRVACFLQAMLALQPGTTLLFDDYPSRGHYSIVEDIVRPRAICGNQAIFERPKDINKSAANSMLDHFRYVFD